MRGLYPGLYPGYERFISRFIPQGGVYAGYIPQGGVYAGYTSLGVCRVYLPVCVPTTRVCLPVYMPPCPWWVYCPPYHAGYTHHPGYTQPHYRPSVRLHVTDLTVLGREEDRGAQSGNNPWVRGEVRLRVVIPVKVGREEVRRVTPLLREKPG